MSEEGLIRVEAPVAFGQSQVRAVRYPWSRAYAKRQALFAAGFLSFGAGLWFMSGYLGMEIVGRVAMSGFFGLLPGLLLVYGTVAQLVNHTTVFASDEQLWTTSQPFKSGLNKPLDRRDVRSLEAREAHGTWAIFANTTSGGQRLFAASIASSSQARALVRFLEEASGVE